MTENSFSQFWSLRSFKIKVPVGLIPGEGSLSGLQTATSSQYPLIAERESSLMTSDDLI